MQPSFLKFFMVQFRHPEFGRCPKSVETWGKRYQLYLPRPRCCSAADFGRGALGLGLGRVRRRPGRRSNHRPGRSRVRTIPITATVTDTRTRLRLRIPGLVWWVLSWVRGLLQRPALLRVLSVLAPPLAVLVTKQRGQRSGSFERGLAPPAHRTGQKDPAEKRLSNCRAVR